MSTSDLHARGANTEAIAAATGTVWADWIVRLDAAGAQQLPTHGEIAALALAQIRDPQSPECANPEWWAQSVAVAYEQHLGRRLPGQRPDGTFDANASRTVTGGLDEAIDRVVTVLAAEIDSGAGRLRSVAVAEGPRVSATQKWRYWRASLADGSRVDLTVSQKPTRAGGDAPTRSTVAVGHRRVVSPEEAAAWKAFWRQLLDRI